MEPIFNKVCVLVTAAFALTLVPGFRRSESSLLSVRDRGTALLVFMLLGLAEQVAVGRSSWYNHRIVAACSAGLLAGASIGTVVAAFVTWLAVAYDGRPLVICGLAMLSGALAGGWLYRWRPRLARHPLTGFCLTATVSCLRDSLIFLCTPGMGPVVQIFTRLGIALVLQGLGTALILAVVALIRDRDQQTAAAASAEVCALQLRMNPHFLCNALNTFATLATIAPHEIPRAAGRLRHFLRASFDQSDRTLIPLEEELTVVRAYLDIESLRLGNRLILELAIESGLTEVLVPPFSLQPLVENALQHSLQCCGKPRCLCLVVCRRIGEWLDIIVSDDGTGAPSTQSKQIFFTERLTLLRRRLRELYSRSFKLEVHSEVGGRTAVTMRIPLRVITLYTRRNLTSAGASLLPRLVPKEEL
jgi:two-component system, LytTR family, sensor kinase